MFEKNSRDALIVRINTLTESSQGQWGKMNVSQMVRHLRLWEEMIHQNIIYKRAFIGRLLGRMMLRKELKTPEMAKNNPSVPELVVKDTSIDLQDEKQKLIGLLHQYPSYSYPDHSFTHAFFGKMTKDEIGRFAYKHMDHHLKQFNC